MKTFRLLLLITLLFTLSFASPDLSKRQEEPEGTEIPDGGEVKTGPSFGRPHIPKRQGPGLGVPVQVIIKGGSLDGQTTIVEINLQTKAANQSTNTTNPVGTFEEERTQSFIKRIDSCFLAGCDSCVSNFEDSKAIKCERCLPGHVLFKAVMQGRVTNGVNVPSVYSDAETDICLPAVILTLKKEKQQTSIKESFSFLARINPERILVGEEEEINSSEKVALTVAFAQSPPETFWEMYETIQSAVMGKSKKIIEAGIKSFGIHPLADESFRFPRAKVGKIDLNAKQEAHIQLEKAKQNTAPFSVVKPSSSSSSGSTMSTSSTKRSSRSKRGLVTDDVDLVVIFSNLAVCPSMNTGSYPNYGCYTSVSRDGTYRGHPQWSRVISGTQNADGTGTVYDVVVYALTDVSSPQWVIGARERKILADGTKEHVVVHAITTDDFVDRPWKATFTVGFVGLKDMYFFQESCSSSSCGNGKFSVTDSLVNGRPVYENVDAPAYTLSASSTRRSWMLYKDALELEIGSTTYNPLTASWSNRGTCVVEACDASTSDSLSCFEYLELGSTSEVAFEEYTAVGTCDADTAEIEFSMSCTGEPSCFPEGSLVRMADGSNKLIQDLSVGDRVMSLDQKTGLLSPTQVYGFFHHDNQSKEIPFLSIECEDQKTSLSISPNHYLLKYQSKEEKSSFDYVPARSLKKGDILQTCDEEGLCAKVSIKSIKVEKRNGLFAPMTWTGTLIVDGVVASMYAEYSPDGGSVEVMDALSFVFSAPTKMINTLYPQADPSMSLNHHIHPVASLLMSLFVGGEKLINMVGPSFFSSFLAIIS